MNDFIPIASPGPDDVHIWWIDLDRIDADVLAILSADERARADRFRRQRDRERWIAARAALRLLMAQYVGAAPETLRFTPADRWRKPALAGGSPLRFSLTHAGDRAALAVAWERDVGIDLELIDAALDVAPLLAVACTPDERARIEGLPPAERIEAFLALWTMKEAYLKAVGTGLSRDPRTIAVDQVPITRAAIRAADTVERSETGFWSLRQLDPEPGWVAALAIAGADANVSERHWPVGP